MKVIELARVLPCGCGICVNNRTYKRGWVDFKKQFADNYEVTDIKVSVETKTIVSTDSSELDDVETIFCFDITAESDEIETDNDNII